MKKDSQVDEIVKALWNRDARAWRRHWVPVFQRFVRDLVADAQLSRGQIVLDVGTGTGVAAIEALKYVKPGGIVLGIDRSAPILEIARTEHSARRNVCFLEMSAERITLPNQFFDAVISNCGVSPVSFQEIAAEVFRVLGRSGSLTFNDWRLIDVPVHRVFGEILRKYRTPNPSRGLRKIRNALAESERVGNRFSELRTQESVLRRAGFRQIRVKTRLYRVKLPSTRAYLAMRFDREALRAELKELSSKQRREMMEAMNAELRQFMRRGRFVMDWKVRFIHATKPA